MRLLNGFLLIMALLLLPIFALAGSLDSPAAPADPASAMSTLGDIYNRLDSGAAGTKRSGAFVEPVSGPTTGTNYTLDAVMSKAPAQDETDAAGVAEVGAGKTFWGLKGTAWGPQTGTGIVNNSHLAETGQTLSYASGDDGNLQNGVAWPDPRFTDNGDGTVTDNLTELIWLQNADCYGLTSWTAALDAANALASGSCNLSDGSSAGDWRLANRNELFSLIDFSRADPALPMGYPFIGVQSANYWSATTSAVDNNAAWVMDLNDASMTGIDKGTGAHYVWPVRGGHRGLYANKDLFLNTTRAVGSNFSTTFDADTFINPAGLPMTYLATLSNGDPLPDWLSFDSTTRTFSGKVAYEYCDGAVENIVVTANDGVPDNTASSYGELVISNIPTYFRYPHPDRTYRASESIYFQIDPNAVDDVENAPRVYTSYLANGDPLPDWITFSRDYRLNWTGGKWVGTAPLGDCDQDWELVHEFTPFCESTRVEPFNIHIYDEPIFYNENGDRPMPNQVVYGGVPFENIFREDSFIDKEGVPFTYSATMADGSPLPDWLEFTPEERKFSGTAPDVCSWFGELEVAAIEEKCGGATALFEFEIYNAKPDLNQLLQDQETERNAPFEYIFADNSFLDENDIDAEITYTAKLNNGDPLPTWIEFDASLKQFSGTTPDSCSEMATVKVTAADPCGLTADDTFDIFFNNRTPVANQELVNQFVLSNTAFEYLFAADTFSDQDNNNPLSYVATQTDGTALPAWLLFDGATRKFHGTTPDTCGASINIRVTATDPCGAEVFKDFVFETSPGSPTYNNLLDDQIVPKGTYWEYIFPADTFTSSGGMSLSYSVSKDDGDPLPAWITFSRSERKFSGTAPTFIDYISVIVTGQDTCGGRTEGSYELQISN